MDTSAVRCAGCGTEMVGDLMPDGRGSRYQFDNALWIGFHGGYGMFIDPFGSTPVLSAGQEAVVCHGCAHELCDAVGWIARLLDPARSHSHRAGQDWTGHVGWDLPHGPPSPPPHGGPADDQ